MIARDECVRRPDTETHGDASQVGESEQAACPGREHRAGSGNPSRSPGPAAP